MTLELLAKPLVDQAKPMLLSYVDKSKASFMSRFGHWTNEADKLESIFLRYGIAEIEHFSEHDPARIQDWVEVKRTILLELDTLSLEVKIIGGLDARQFLRDEIQSILSYVPMVAGIMVKVALPALIPGMPPLVSNALGAGVESFLNRVMS